MFSNVRSLVVVGYLTGCANRKKDWVRKLPHVKKVRKSNKLG
jgi:hypothetical protein